MILANLSNDIDVDHIEELFITFGPITKVELNKPHHSSCVVHYEHVEDAEAAIDNAHNWQVLGNTITVKKLLVD